VAVTRKVQQAAVERRLVLGLQRDVAIKAVKRLRQQTVDQRRLLLPGLHRVGERAVQGLEKTQRAGRSRSSRRVGRRHGVLRAKGRSGNSGGPPQDSLA
jgi:hypothetical protein